MNLFKSFTMTWWQLGLLKLCLFCVGIIFGVYFQAFFLQWIVIVTILFVTSGIYIGSVWLKQRTKSNDDNRAIE